MPVQSLTAAQLRRVCTDDHFDFETTAELDATHSIIGQPRGTRAIEFGIGILNQGYNVFVVGELGTGRTTAIKRFLREKTSQQPPPPDWVYVHNFAIPHQPNAISLPPGQGASFKRHVAELLDNLKKELPKAFDSDAYRETVEEIERRFAAQQEELLNEMQRRAAEEEFALVSTASGPLIAPVADGKIMRREAVEALPVAERQALEKQQASLNNELEDLLYRMHQLENEMQAELRALRREVAEAAIAHHFERWQQRYDGQPEVVNYLRAFQEDVLDHLDDFEPQEEGDGHRGEAADLRRYEINLFVDNSEVDSAPVVVELHPTYYNLMGRIEYEIFENVMAPHFTTLKAGSLHRANGGYLVLKAREIIRHRDAWEALKRAIEGEEIRLQTPEALDGSRVMARSLDPEPIPLQVKIIMLGSPNIYYMLYDKEEEFGSLFKVKADFDSIMPRDDEHEQAYALFIANRCREEGLRHFDRVAVEKVVEYGSRLSGDQKRLSTRFGDVADLVREANYWAGQAERDVVTAQDVQQALQERLYRANRLEERIRDQILEGDIFIATEGEVVGQVNGLSVVDMGDHAFGQPGRITARTYMGEGGVVNIEREVDMAGPIHNKGLLTLVGYLGGMYAQTQPFSLSASLTFEQNYAEVDGDSASAAELYALLSSLSELPVQQSVAVTGSINQRGEMQPVGGVTEKIEGFFTVCQARGLTGEQGVIIPAANVNNLMLRPELVQAVEDGRFHIWAVDNVDDCMELLLCRPAGGRDAQGSYPPETVHGAVQVALRRLALNLKSFGDDDEEH